MSSKPPLQPAWSIGGGGGGSPPPPPPTPPPPSPPPKKPTVKTGLGEEVDAIVDQSPTLKKNIKQLQDDGWTIKYGPAGGGSECNRETKTILVDSDEKGDFKEVTQTIAHESGHALYTPDAYVPPDGLTREQYIARNTHNLLKDEGEATLTNAKVRDEILEKSGGKTDIGIAGAQAKKYAEIAKKYPDAADRDKARDEIAKIYAKGEQPSGEDGKNYEEYYSKTYADFWDENVAKK